MSEFTDETDCYRYLLRLSEELWKNAGVPEELKKKYELIKERSFEKVRTNKMKNDSLLDIIGKSDTDKLVTEEVGYFLEMIITSNNTLYERTSALLSHITSMTQRSDVTESSNSAFQIGLITENKNQFALKLKSIRDLEKSGSLKQNLDYFLQTQVPKFERIENKLIKNILKIEEQIIKQNGKVLEMEDIIDKLQENEQKFKLEIDMLSSKLNQWKQLQSIEQLEKHHDLQDQIQTLKETLRKTEMAHEFELNKIKDHYETLLGEIQEKDRTVEKQLAESAIDMKERDQQRIEELTAECEAKDKDIEYLQTIIRTFRVEFKPFYEKYIKTHNKSFDTKSGEKKTGDELSDLIYFIVYLLQKFENDNLWLVDKLTEIGNENEQLKTKLEGESALREEFDGIFKKLRTELQESKYAFLEWENSIESLKKFLDEEKESAAATTRRY